MRDVRRGGNTCSSSSRAPLRDPRSCCPFPNENDGCSTILVFFPLAALPAGSPSVTSYCAACIHGAFGCPADLLARMGSLSRCGKSAEGDSDGFASSGGRVVIVASSRLFSGSFGRPLLHLYTLIPSTLSATWEREGEIETGYLERRASKAPDGSCMHIGRRS